MIVDHKSQFYDNMSATNIDKTIIYQCWRICDKDNFLGVPIVHTTTDGTDFYSLYHRSINY